MTIFTVTNLNDSGSGSLRQAILDANTTSGDDLITFDTLLSGATINLTSDELFISDGLTIDGDLDDDGLPDITIQRDATASQFRIFNIDDGRDVFESYVTFEGIIITGGSATSGGGGISTLEDLTIKSSTITGNAAVSGGGIYSFDNDIELSPGSISVIDSVISNNIATKSGGGILGGRIVVTNSTISGNTASVSGGGIIAKRGGSTEVDNSVISGNTAASGGGIAIEYAGNLTTNNSTISDNSATANGGGIHVDIQPIYASRSFGESNITLSNSTLSGNFANGGGGGIFNYGAELTVSKSRVTNNSTEAPGGGIFVGNSRTFDFSRYSYVNFGSLSINDTTISGNSTQGANSDGGGIYSAAVDVAVRNSTISGNTTQGANGDGGGIYSTFQEFSSFLSSYEPIKVPGSLTVTNSTLSGNTTNGFGGGINSTEANQLTLSNSTVTDNTAPDGQGSGVAVYTPTYGDYGPFGSPIFNYYTFSSASSIIAGNVNSDVDFTDVSPSTVSGDNNLLGTSNDIAAFTQPGNITGVTDPGLEPLTDNGGPTQTHALQPDSLAIDAGSSPNSLATDQRGSGFARVINGQADIGAFESQTALPSLTLSIDPTNISENGESATATVTRSTDTADALTVLLNSSDPGEAAVPDSVVILAGQESATFQVLGVDDDIVDGAQTTTITAAAGLSNGIATLEVTDDDVPARSGFFFSADKDTSVGSLTVADEDIIQFDGTNFSIFFDGSDVLNTNIEIDAFDIVDQNTILMSFDKRITLAELGQVDDSDIVKFTATSLGGGTTSGTFDMYLDGSDLALTKYGEDIDALTRMADGSLIFSTTGNAKLSNGLKTKDEDLIRFDADSGDISLYFDGGDIDLGKRSEDINAVGLNNDELLLSTTGKFVVPRVSGANEDVFRFTPSSTGNTTSGNFGEDLLFDGSQFGFTGDLSGFDFSIG